MVQIEIGSVQIHFLSLVVRILGHGVIVGPTCKKKKAISV